MGSYSDSLPAIYETIYGYLALGNSVTSSPDAELVHNSEFPSIYDANFVHSARAESSDDIDALLDRADEAFSGSGHRRLFVDPWTPPSLEAELTVRGFEHHGEVQLVLEGSLDSSKASTSAAIHLVESEADWTAVERLMHLDREEQAAREDSVFDADVTRQLVATRRAKVPDVRFWLARLDGADCAYFSSWPGSNGVGEVEYLFTNPDFRRRGIAAALIRHSVEDARDRGANAVVIGARVDDTPKEMYEAMGFRPACMNRGYLKTNG